MERVGPPRPPLALAADSVVSLSVTASGVTPAVPSVRGLYDPQWEHDACGIGAPWSTFPARRSHAIVEHGKQVLLNLMHRGAAGADESTGDGAGILMQVPARVLRGPRPSGWDSPLPPQGRYGVAHAFPAARRPELRQGRAKRPWRPTAEAEGLGLLGLAQRADRQPLSGRDWHERPNR